MRQRYCESVKDRSVLRARAARPRVLTADDDRDLIETETEALRREGYQVEAAFSGDEAIEKARRTPFDVALTGLEMPAMRGLGLLHRLEAVDPEMPIVVCAPLDQASTVLEAFRQGAYEFLPKPVHVPTLVIRVTRALERRRLNDLVEVLSHQTRGRDHLGELLGVSLSMQLIYQEIQHLAGMSNPVLLQGEPGVGKEAAAREIHRLGPCSEMPFIAVPPDVLSGQLLAEQQALAREETRGARSASTLMGVLHAKPGASVLLEEVGRISIGAQEILLRLLTEAESRSMDAHAGVAPAIRIFSTTSMDLDQSLEDGTFLPALYHYLSAFIVRVPPLRARREDIQIAILRILESECARANKPLRRWSPRALELLTRYDWPGNVSELRSIVERVVATSRYGVIGPRDLAGCDGIMTRVSRPRTLEEVQQQHIVSVLNQVAGNKRRAAELLGIARSSFYRKVKKMDLSP